MRIGRSGIGAATLSLGLLSGFCLADDDEVRQLPRSERPQVEVFRLDRAPKLEDFLEMKPPPDLADRMKPITGFTQREPEDGQPASQRTEVYMGYDVQFLYVIFVAFDEDPEKIRAHLSRREQVFSDETVEIQLDTFTDERRAFSFLANPYGIQWDAIWTEGQGFDSSWDTVWNSRGQLTDRGYVVWMAIPFKSLRFPPQPDGESQSWGVVLVRDIPRNNETSFWPRVSNRIEGRLNQSGTASGFESVAPGRNVWLIPYVAAGLGELKSAPGAPTTNLSDADVGLDAKWVIKDSLTFDFTANPNFAQVESDEPQVTVNRRFEVFFPERRPFFLENADYFRTPVNLVFTRRIADPDVGVRLTGQVNRYQIGALVIDDEAPGKLAPLDSPLHGTRAWNGIVRVSRDLNNQSWVGLLATDREWGDSYNRVGGFDTRVKFDANWDTRAQVVYSTTRVADPNDPSDVVQLSDPAYDVAFNREGRKVNVHMHYVDIGEQFNTRLGFIPRTDIRDTHVNFNYSFWREGGALVRFRPNARVQRVTNHDGVRLDEGINLSANWEFRRRTRFSVFGRTGQERLLKCQDYFDATCDPEIAGAPLADDLDFDVGELGVNFGSQFITAVDVSGAYLEARTANFFPPLGQAPTPADERIGEFEVTLRIGRHLRWRTGYLYTNLEEQDSGRDILTNQIVRSRFDWQFNPRLSLRAILQYDDTKTDETLTRTRPQDNLNTDLLVTYLVNPWTALYAGFNTNQTASAIIDDERVLMNDRYNNASQVFIKISYLFRP